MPVPVDGAGSNRDRCHETLVHELQNGTEEPKTCADGIRQPAGSPMACRAQLGDRSAGRVIPTFDTSRPL